MEERTLKILEYDKIKILLRDKAGSLWGKDLAMALLPEGDFAAVQENLAETEEAARIISLQNPPLGDIHDIRPLLKKAKLGAEPTAAEILDLLATMYAMGNVKRFFKELELESPLLKARAREIEILGELRNRLENTIDEHGHLRDEASVELSRLRRELRVAKVKIKERMNAILHNDAYQKYFQETIITLRDDRYVIPVKQEYRRDFPGLIHDQSASGSTLFIEPLAVAELNNDVKQLTLAEEQEVKRILRELMQSIGRHHDILEDNAAILANIDLIFAKARLAQDMKATKPLLNTEGITELKQARHPLINPAEVVPIDLRLGEGYRLLLVTGPNTGGKTVSMKTFGLLVLMAASGLFIPAAENSRLALYQNIYADIGDEQSIEQSLSTFSAHMTHLVDILGQAEREDLVLLDELAAGTDPAEGSALAMAILERLADREISTVATTHYSELKTFAYSREGIENASVEFDLTTLRPTYRLIIGTPGASNAFAISRRLGLAESLVLRAKQLMQADHAQFENVINDLEREKLSYEQKNAEITEREAQVAKLEEKLAAAKTDLTRQKGEILRRAKEQSAALVRRTRREAEEIIKALKEQFDDQGIKKRQQALQAARERLSEAEERSTPGIMSEKGVGKRIKPGKIAPGDTVYVVKLAQKGTVLSVKGKEIEVQIGSLKTTLKSDDCRFVATAPQERPTAKIQTTGGFVQKAATTRREIDIRGMMVDEAEGVVGKFMDDALMAGIGEVIIIHGKGTGALRKGIHDYLKHHPSVLNFTLADMSEGGSGATVVELK
ncbi:MAG: endonuclease MutS2 [Selenomonadaceae bacterium]|nr:endonuclease MutS2 [Selenomonadaceae bacterium]